jgi:glycosyltransferase involved in cell wall biosynthesis
MRVALVTTYDPRDPAVRSGWAHHMLRSFRDARVEVDAIGPLRERGRVTGRVRARAEARLAGRVYDPYRAVPNGRTLSRQVARLADGADVVLTTECVPVSHLDQGKPVVLWADATFARLVDFYPDFTGLTRATRRDGETLERRGLERCDLAVFSSHWAAASAIDHYGIDVARVAVVPWGANLDEVPSSDDVAAMTRQRRADHDLLRVLFLGGDWPRKGGPVAVSCVRELNRRGVRAELTVVGCRIPAADDAPFVHVLGPVDKYDGTGGRVLRRALADAHVLLLPTTADCTPLAVAEAAAFGVPAIVADVGGLAEMVDDRSGSLLPAGSPPSAYADALERLHRDPDALDAMSRGARCRFETELNWPVATRRMAEMLEQVR